MSRNPIEQMVADRVAADPVTAALVGPLRQAVTEALDSHLPRLAYNQSDTAAMLGVSPHTVSEMVREGKLRRLAGPQSPITLGSILAAVDWPMQPVAPSAPLAGVPDVESGAA